MFECCLCLLSGLLVLRLFGCFVFVAVYCVVDCLGNYLGFDLIGI